MVNGNSPNRVVYNAVIAAVIGLGLLALSYFHFPEHSFWGDLSHEIGFALIVAVVIWSAFELFKQMDVDDQWNNRLEMIAKNVFFGVFKRNFPPDFIKEANVLVLENQFVRTGLHLTYTLNDNTYTDRFGAIKSFVKLSAVARCKMQNVANVNATLPISIGLPNPLIDEMKAVCKVNMVSIKQGGREEKPDLGDAEDKFRQAMSDDNTYMVPFRVKELQLAPGEEIELRLEYSMAKEEEDTEFFQTRFPCDSVKISLVDQGPTKRAVRARSIHARELENDTSAEATGVYTFNLDHYFLPHQGFAIWWKKIPTEPIVPLRN